MKNFIEELFYDNIKPQEKSIRRSDLCKEELQLLHEHEQHLLCNLPNELKSEFIEYADIWGIINGKTVLEGFTSGFKLGANFATDTFGDNKCLLKTFTEEK
ncbi:MAG: hypothetical protein IJA17_01860 [Oscillospiraceae bacterium]|nr:hypothetical protein [Oscillospiraceae bacterium]